MACCKAANPQAGRHKQAGRLTPRQAGRQAGRQADPQAGRQAGRQADPQAGRQAGRSRRRYKPLAEQKAR